jgi:hypothetical protein
VTEEPVRCGQLRAMLVLGAWTAALALLLLTTLLVTLLANRA